MIVVSKDKILDEIKEYFETKSQSWNNGGYRIPVSGVSIKPDDYVAIADALLDAPPLTEWEWCRRFERALEEYLNVRCVVLCNSGSSAVLLAILAVKEYYNLRNGDKVVTTALSFPTTVAPLYYAGLKPIFVDVNLDLTPKIDDLSNSEAVGGIFTHTLGLPFDAEAIDNKLMGKFLIEDACDALGTIVNVKHVGTFGDIGTLSFFPAHHITTIEGGAVFTNNPKIERIVRSFANWGRDCWCRPGESNVCGKRFGWSFNKMPYGYDHKYTFTRLGFNLKMNELEAALGYSQLSRIQTVIEKRRVNYSVLRNIITELDKEEKYLKTIPLPNGASPFGFPIILAPNTPFVKREIIQYLEQNKIATRSIFAGNITRQPMLEEMEYDILGELKNTDYLMERAFWIGCHDGIDNDKDLPYVYEVLDKFLEKYR